ncbi:jg3327 [Pararge aegeria aegeria]|uniref:Jg3327 protein n=1 Tax=Pararge aegeria aegeria TaxID=348720 RepID=A0A8S4RTS9_9NEOP|nr:jg3327 [Pararge aegeria aegeria]
MPDLAPTEIARALEMRRNGQTYRVISKNLCRPVSTIHRSIQRLRETGTYVRRAGLGKKRRTSTSDDSFIRLRDNAWPHTTWVTQAGYLNDMNITVMEWPARSPDMNPIEHVWDLLKRKVKSRIPAPANVGELRISVVEEWRRLSQETIDNIILSMPRR